MAVSDKSETVAIVSSNSPAQDSRKIEGVHFRLPVVRHMAIFLMTLKKLTKWEDFCFLENR
jgi:hypothetical protein